MTVGGSFPSLVTIPRRRKRPRNNKMRSSTDASSMSVSTEIRNPRALFPVRDDFIRSAWVRRTRTERAQEYEELYPYLPGHPLPGAPRDSTAAVATITTATITEAAAETEQKPMTPQNHHQAPGDTRQNKPRGGGTSATAVAASRGGGGTKSQNSHMGVGTGPSNVAELRRAFRRLEPENMFRAPRAEGEPIWAYWGGQGYSHGQSQPPLPPGKRASTKDGFVLVPATELKELRALEGALRKERGILKAHCLVALKEGEVSAHRPLELTRMAVHGACGREMATALREYRAWNARRSNGGGYGGGCGGGAHGNGGKSAPQVRSLLARGRPGVDVGVGVGKRAREAASNERVSELQRTPTGWRTLRWMMMKRQAELKNQVAEAAAMYAEEMEQRLKERYLEAWERRHDYDLYCVLAGQFWPLEAEAFRGCTRPGKKLFLEIEAPAMVITRMWKTCWPFRKDRKRKGCLGLQALWRGHRVRKRWRPIVRLRVRNGRRSVLRPCFSSWARAARVHRWARRRFEEIEGRWERLCFYTWVEWTADLAAEKRRKLERAGKTLQNIAAYRSFRSWQLYTRATRQAQRLYARIVGGPALAAWVRYMGEARNLRKRGSAAVTIQRHARGYIARGRYRATQTIIQGFNRLMTARRARHFLRDALVAAHRRAANELLQAGCDAEITAGVAREERRLAKMQKELNAVDAAVRRAVNGRLNGGGWLSPAMVLKGRPSSRGGGELRREMKAVREEIDAKAAAATAAKDGATVATAAAATMTPSAVSKPKRLGRGGGGGGGGGGDGGGLGKTWPRIGFLRLPRMGSPGDSKKPAHGGDGQTRPTSATTGSAAVTTAKNVTPRTMEEVEREARRRILSRERDLARELVVHDFDVGNPPPLKCCAPGCGRTFTQDDHYLAHWDAATAAGRVLPQHDARPPSRPPSRPTAADAGPPEAAEQAGAEAGHPELGGKDIALFHLLVADKAEKKGPPRDHPEPDAAGLDLAVAYITRVWGHGQAYNTLLFVDAVGSWRRRRLTAEPGFVKGAADLGREFVYPGAPREARLPEDTRRELMRVLDTLPGDLLGHAAAAVQVAGGAAEEDDIGKGSSETNRGGSIAADRGSGEPDPKTKTAAPIAHSTKRQQRQRGVAKPPASSAVMAAASAAAADPAGLRPTSFDKAQFQALVHLSRVVGPGFWASDLGRRAAALHAKDLKLKREAAHEIVRLERKERLANEAAEIRKQLSSGRDSEKEALVESALNEASDSVLEALLRSAAAGVEFLAMRELEVAREEEMVAEAATVEAVWVVEPPLLEQLLDAEVSAFCAEGEEQELMALEDDWVPPEIRMADFLNGLKTAMVITLDFNSIPGGEEGARQAATTIQLSWRQRSARVEARRRLAQVYVKRPGHGPGEVYYEHTITGLSQWERPLIAYRLFPNSNW